MSSREALSVTCDTCGFEDTEPMHGIVYVVLKRLRERGWMITDDRDICAFCIAEDS